MEKFVPDFLSFVMESSDSVFEYAERNFEFEEACDVSESEVKRTEDGVVYRGETFPGYNKPKKYTGPGKFKKRVLAKEGDKIKVLNFGHRDYEDYTQHGSAERRKNFRSRMQCDKGKLSKLTKRYWACQHLW
jgi:hypothetical protein